MHSIIKAPVVQVALLSMLATLLPAVLLGSTRVIGGPCDGCELIFTGMPTDLSSASRIAPPAEPGEPLVLEGVVRHLDGSPAAGVIVYAYHTDARGLYPRDATVHGRLRGWARTDNAGTYRFISIRPGAYPSGDTSQHIHVHVLEAGKGTYYIDNITFNDDPLLTSRERKESENGRGGSGLTIPKMKDGSWHIQRDIILGKNIPGYK